MGDENPEPELIESAGPWPFVTRRVYRLPDRTHVMWHSRVHRKRLPGVGRGQARSLATTLLRSLWMPDKLNWWIGIIFALGSSLFVVGSVLSLAPGLAQAWSLDTRAVNMIFFAGSIPFTAAAYLQLFQSANAGEFSPMGITEKPRTVAFGWRPQNIGWLSCALQFPGTLLFNVNTFDALLPGLNWLRADLLIWTPDIIGSVCFLIASGLAYTEYSHGSLVWKPRDVSWRIVCINLLGSVAFGIAAVYAIILPGDSDILSAWNVNFFTFAGGLCFLVGAYLLIPEAARNLREIVRKKGISVGKR